MHFTKLLVLCLASGLGLGSLIVQQGFTVTLIFTVAAPVSGWRMLNASPSSSAPGLWGYKLRAHSGRTGERVAHVEGVAQQQHARARASGLKTGVFRSKTED